MKALRIFTRSIRDSFKSVFRNFSLSLASISCITITLIVVAISIILSYNVNKFTKLVEGDVTIVAFIDNSKNDAFRILEKRSAQIRYIHNENIGYGGAHNIAIREAMTEGAKFHLVVNPDIYFEKNAIDELINYMDNNTDVGQMMPKVFYPNGELQYLCKMVPAPLDLIFKRFLPSALTRKRLHKFQLRFTGYDKTMNVPYLSGCFMLFRVAALQEVGLFDERFFMYPEDIDMTRRMHEKYKTIFYPAVSIIHAHEAASKTNFRMLWIHISNMVKYFNKWGWFFDKQRKLMNANLLNELNYNG